METKTQYGIACAKCLDIIYSNYTHDFVECSCGSCYVDGGFDYMRVGGSPDERLYAKRVIEWPIKKGQVKIVEDTKLIFNTSEENEEGQSVEAEIEEIQKPSLTLNFKTVEDRALWIDWYIQLAEAISPFVANYDLINEDPPWELQDLEQMEFNLVPKS